MENKKIRELYNQYLLTDIISFYKFKKSLKRSYKFHSDFYKGKPSHTFLQFISKSVHWNNIYGVEYCLKDMQEFYKKENIKYHK